MHPDRAPIAGRNDRASNPKFDQTEADDRIGQAMDQPGSRPRTDLATPDDENRLDAIGQEACQQHRRPRRFDRAPVPERHDSRGSRNRTTIAKAAARDLPCNRWFK